MTMTTECIDHGQKGNPKGYGWKWSAGKPRGIHRVVFCEANSLHIDEIAGLVVRHQCDNPRCINPEHLLLGTFADNHMDMSVRRRHSRVRLSHEDVKYIRAHCRPNRLGENQSNNDFSYNALGRKFGIDPSSIRDVYLGKSFKAG